MSRDEKFLLFLMGAIQFVHIVDFMIIMPLGDLLMRLFEITPQQFGWLVSCYTFAAGISGLLASLFIDRFDRRSAVLFFIIGFSVGTIACAFAPNFWTLLVARSLTGMFGGVLTSIVMAIVSDQFSYERRGHAMGVVMGAFSLASIFGVPFALKLADMISWHAPFLCLGITAFLVTLLITLRLPHMTAHLNSRSDRRVWAAFQHVLQSREQQIALVFMFCLTLGQFSVIPFISPSMIANAGLEQNQLAYMYLCGGICSMFASPLVGRFSDRFGKHVVFNFSVLLSFIPLYLITNLSPMPIWMILAVSSSFFIMMSGRMVPAMAMVSSAAPPESRASFMSISSAVQQLSGALAASMAGTIVTRAPTGQLLHYRRVGAIAIAFSGIAYFAAKRLRTDSESASKKKPVDETLAS